MQCVFLGGVSPLIIKFAWMLRFSFYLLNHLVWKLALSLFAELKEIAISMQTKFHMVNAVSACFELIWSWIDGDKT